MAGRFTRAHGWIAAGVVAAVVTVLFFALGLHRAFVRTTRALVQKVTGTAPEVPVIEAGRERDVMALFAEHPLGSYPAPGWRFMQLTVLPRSILVRVDGPAGRTASMTLRHPDDVGDASTGDTSVGSRTASFAVVRARDGHASPDGDLALDVLVGDLARNDPGKFWRVHAAVASDDPDGRNTPPGAVSRTLGFAQDGVVVAALLLLALAMLLARTLRGEPRSTLGWLCLTALAGALYRFVLSVPTTMDVWPYSRLLAVPRMLFESRILGALSSRFGWRIHLNELVLGYDMTAALLAPFAVFAHARALLRDTRAALWAAALIATLPSHIRFAHSDSGFIPSAVYASMTFALMSQAMRDPSRAFRVAALVCVPGVMLITMEQRALNTMFPVLYVAQVWLLQPPEVPRLRRAVATGLIALTAAGFVLGGFVERYQGPIDDGLQLRTVYTAAAGLVSPRFNTLIHPGVTPPLGLALAVGGLVALWRGGQRRLCAFLIVWPGMFYAANAVIRPTTVEMQSRYHLHLAAPFVLAGGWGARALFEFVRTHPRTQHWSVVRFRLGAAAFMGWLALTPLMHLAYERRADFNDIREYAFVRKWRDRIPKGCTVMEHYEPGNPNELRFGRMSRVLDRGKITQDLRAVLMTANDGRGKDPLLPAARALLADPPDCLMFYRGLPCLGIKDPGEPIAPACDAVLQGAPMDRVDGETFPNRPYDEAVSKGVMFQNVQVEIGLYRVRVDEIRARGGARR